MNCRGIGKLLERFMDGELGERDRERVERHLETCADCRRRLDEIGELSAAIKMTAPAAQPEEYWDAVSDRFWQARRKRSTSDVRRPSSVVRRWAALAAAGIFLALVGVATLTFIVHRSSFVALNVPPATSAPAESAFAGIENRQAAVKRPTTNPGAEPSSMAREATPREGTAGERLSAAGRQPPAGGSQPSASPRIASRYGEARGAPPTPAPRPSVPAPYLAASHTARLGQAKVSPQVATERPGVIERGEVELPDTAIYGSNDLQEKPALVSAPAPSDNVKKAYPGMQLPVWIVVEKDGSVSAVNVRSNQNLHGLDTIVEKLVRGARFTPGRVNGKPVRSATVFTFRIGKSAGDAGKTQ